MDAGSRSKSEEASSNGALQGHGRKRKIGDDNTSGQHLLRLDATSKRVKVEPKDHFKDESEARDGVAEVRGRSNGGRGSIIPADTPAKIQQGATKYEDADQRERADQNAKQDAETETARCASQNSAAESSIRTSLVDDKAIGPSEPSLQVSASEKASKSAPDDGANNKVLETGTNACPRDVAVKSGMNRKGAEIDSTMEKMDVVYKVKASASTNLQLLVQTLQPVPVLASKDA